MEEVEVEEVEEEDPDVHFKRKRQGVSRRKRVVKKPRCYIPTVITKGESVAVPSSPAPLVIKHQRRSKQLIKLFPAGVRPVSFLRHVFHAAHLFIL